MHLSAYVDMKRGLQSHAIATFFPWVWIRQESLKKGTRWQCDPNRPTRLVKLRHVIERSFNKALCSLKPPDKISKLLWLTADTNMWLFPLINHSGMKPDASSFSFITWSVFRATIPYKSVWEQTHQTRQIYVSPSWALCVYMQKLCSSVTK